MAQIWQEMLLKKKKEKKKKGLHFGRITPTFKAHQMLCLGNEPRGACEAAGRQLAVPQCSHAVRD